MELTLDLSSPTWHPEYWPYYKKPSRLSSLSNSEMASAVDLQWNFACTVADIPFDLTSSRKSTTSTSKMTKDTYAERRRLMVEGPPKLNEALRHANQRHIQRAETPEAFT